MWTRVPDDGGAAISQPVGVELPAARFSKFVLCQRNFLLTDSFPTDSCHKTGECIDRGRERALGDGPNRDTTVGFSVRRIASQHP